MSAQRRIRISLAQTKSAHCGFALTELAQCQLCVGFMPMPRSGSPRRRCQLSVSSVSDSQSVSQCQLIVIFAVTELSVGFAVSQSVSAQCQIRSGY